ncbi:OPT oligopeptide transporter protein-domain-containing protein [Lipomyces tetrasporus]
MAGARAIGRDVHFYLFSEPDEPVGGMILNPSVTEKNFISMLEETLIVASGPFRVTLRSTGVDLMRTDNALKPGHYDIRPYSRRGNISSYMSLCIAATEIVLFASFIYFFLPDYLFTALSTFNWPTWIAPNNKQLAFITGSKIGLGVNPVSSFDWTIINYSYPLIYPVYTVLNKYTGIALGGLIVLSMTYSNYSYTGYMPPNLSTTNGLFDVEKYRSYSPPYITAGAIVLNGTEYALITFGFTYIVITEWRNIKSAALGFYRSLKNRSGSVYAEYDDPLSRMMAKYPEVPDWWYLVIFAFSLAVGIITIACFPTEVPVWALIAVLAITIALIIPSMILYATSGYMYTVYLLATLFGWILGTRKCLMRVYGFGMDDNGETFVGDQKMGHYAKIPPRSVFRAQFVATVVQVLASMGAWEMLVQGMTDLCSLTQPSKFTCPWAHTLYSQSVLLGLIGPKRTFDRLYPVLKYAFLIGFGVAVACYGLKRLFPRQLHFFHPVLILSGIGYWGSSYNLSYYTPGLIMSVVFNYYVRRRYAIWWAKYNYVLSSALTAGTGFCGILIFLALQYHAKPVTWWGNTVSSEGVEGALNASVYDLPAKGWFGVEAGTWS